MLRSSFNKLLNNTPTITSRLLIQSVVHRFSLHSSIYTPSHFHRYDSIKRLHSTITNTNTDIKQSLVHSSLKELIQSNSSNFTAMQSLYSELDITNPVKQDLSYTLIKLLSFNMLETGIWKESFDRIINQLDNSSTTDFMKDLKETYHLDPQFSINAAKNIINRELFDLSTVDSSSNEHECSIMMLCNVEVYCYLNNHPQAQHLIASAESPLKDEMEELYISICVKQEKLILANEYVSKHQSPRLLSCLVDALCSLQIESQSQSTLQAIDKNVRLLLNTLNILPIQTCLLLIRANTHQKEAMHSLTLHLKESSESNLNLVISELSKHDHVEYALLVVNDLIKTGFKLTPSTLNNLIKTCGQKNMQINGLRLIGYAKNKGFKECIAGVVCFHLDTLDIDAANKAFTDYQCIERQPSNQYALEGNACMIHESYIRYMCKIEKFDAAGEWIDRFMILGYTLTEILLETILKYCVLAKDISRARVILNQMTTQQNQVYQSQINTLFEISLNDKDGLDTAVYLFEKVTHESISTINYTLYLTLLVSNNKIKDLKLALQTIPLDTPSETAETLITLFANKGDSNTTSQLCIQFSTVTFSSESINRVCECYLQHGPPNTSILLNFTSNPHLSNKTLISLFACLTFYIKDTIRTKELLDRINSQKFTNSELEKVFVLMIISGSLTDAYEFLMGWNKRGVLSIHQFSVYLNWIGTSKKASKRQNRS